MPPKQGQVPASWREMNPEQAKFCQAVRSALPARAYDKKTHEVTGFAPFTRNKDYTLVDKYGLRDFFKRGMFVSPPSGLFRDSDEPPEPFYFQVRSVAVIVWDLASNLSIKNVPCPMQQFKRGEDGELIPDPSDVHITAYSSMNESGPRLVCSEGGQSYWADTAVRRCSCGRVFRDWDADVVKQLPRHFQESMPFIVKRKKIMDIKVRNQLMPVDG